MGRPLHAVICNLNSKIDTKNRAVQQIESQIDIKLQEQALLQQIKQITTQINLVNAKEELEERLKQKRQRQQQEDNIRKELEGSIIQTSPVILVSHKILLAYRDQLRLAKLEQEIEQFKIQKDQQEREMHILESIETLKVYRESEGESEEVTKNKLTYCLRARKN